MHKAFKQLPGILGLTLLIVGAGALTAHAEIPLSVVPADNSILFRGGASTITDTFDLHIFTDDRMYLDASTINVAGDINMVPGKLLSLKDGSNIYDNYDMHIATDDRLFLDAPESVNVAGNLNMLQGKTLTLKTGSTISDDMNLHIATDDNMYLDAPTRVYVQNNLNVGGNIAVTGHVISNVTGNLTGNVTGNVTGNISGGTVGGNGASLTNIDGAHIQNGTITSNKLAFSLPGDIALTTADNDFTGTNTFEGDITMDAPDRHATLTLANDGDLNVTGHTTLGSSHWDDLTVNATAEFNNDLTVDGASTLNDDLTVSGVSTFTNDITMNAASRHATLTLANDGDLNVTGHTTLGSSHWDDLTVNATAEFNNDLTVDGASTLNDGLTVTSGDTSLQGLTATTVHGTDAATFDSDATFNGDVYLTRILSSNCGEGCEPVTIGYHSNQQGFKVWGDSDLRGSLTIGGWGSDNNGLIVNGDDGIIMNAASRHALLDLQNDGDINVEGNSTLGSSHWDTLTVNATPTFNNTLSVTNGATFVQGFTATTVHGTAAATFDSTLTTADDITMNAASRHALLDLQNDGDINVEGNSTLGSSHWDTLTVNATAEFNNDLTVDGASTLNDGLTVTSGAAALQGLTATTIHGTDAATFDSTLTTADDITMNAASRHATLTLANDGDLNVTGHTTLGSSSWDDLTVNATSDFGSDVTVSSGNVHVQDGNLNVDNGNTANLNGDVNLGTDSGNDIIVNGRLYGFDGDPLTIGHNSDNSGLKVWGDSDLRGSLTVGGWGSDNTGIDVQSGDITLDDGNLNVNDGTIYASSGLTVAGGSTSLQGTTTTSLHATGAATLDNGLTVTSGATSLQGLTAGNTTVNNLTVNGAATYNGTTTFAGGQTFNSTNVFGGTATFNSTTTHNGAANFTSTATFGSTVTATAGVDFSGASSLRVPVTAAALVDNTTACATTGLVTFSTNDSHFYGCDGSKWQIFDN